MRGDIIREEGKNATAAVLMGVSGSGKTSVGQALSVALGWPFYDGDDFHPQENVEKMAAGVPLDDADRALWLARLHSLIEDHLSAGDSLVLACSALKQRYREQLQGDLLHVRFVFLKGSFDLIHARLQSRPGHYMKAGMLQSQFDDLEPPVSAIVIDIDRPLHILVAEILLKLQ